MTFLGLLAWFGAVDGGTGEVLPFSGTRLSVLALELPRAITPAIAGLTVGAFVGVVGFIAVLLLVGRGSRRSKRRPRMGADQVVFIPPYGTMPRDTPMPPRAFYAPPSSGQMPVAPLHVAQQQAYAHVARGQALPFVPSTQLSARVFAKMRYELDSAQEYDAPNADPMLSIEIDMLDEDDLIPSETPFPAAPAVIVSPVVVLSSTPPRGTVSESGTVRAADKSAPHPLGIIKSTSAAMRAAPIDDLTFDDGETEIGETYFDEPPQPRRRTDPPKIRAIAPSGPRFPAAKDQTPLLPQVTPPPMRAASGPRS